MTLRSRLRPGAAVLAALATVAGMCVIVLSPPGAAADGAAQSCIVTAKLVNPCRPWLGGVATDYPQAAADTKSQILYHEQRIGRQLDIVHTYHPVGTNTLSAADIYFATRANTMLFANWKPSSTWANVSSNNAGIDQMASSIKSLGNHKIFLTLWHEPEGQVSPGGDPNCPNLTYKGSSGTVSDYRNMWRYVENRFAADGVANVVWAIDYVNYAPWDCLVPDLYPGDDLIDWVTFDAYPPPPVGGVTQSFSTTVRRFTNLLSADTDATHSFTSKPWGIVEWAAGARTVADQMNFYASAKAAVDSNAFPNLKMYMIYDSNGGTVPPTLDDRVAYDDKHVLNTAKAVAYASFADDPVLSGAAVLPGADTTPPTTAITAPTDGQTLSGAVTVDAQASDDVSGVSAVQLQVDGQTVASGTPAADGTIHFTLDSTTLSPGDHTLTTTAIDGSGNTGTSPSVVVTAADPNGPPDTSPPTVPGNVTATAVNGTSVTVGWDASTDDTAVTGYTVLRDGNPITTLDPTTTTYTDHGLSPQTTYRYQLEATDGAGNVSTPSTAATVTTPSPADTTPPTVPGNVTASATNPTSVTVGWDASTDDTAVTGYTVLRDGNPITTLDATTTTYTDNGLSPQTTYRYQLEATDAAGNVSTPSTAATVTTPSPADTTPPTVPGNVTATAINGTSVTVGWDPSTDDTAVTGYTVLRDGNPITTLDATTTTYTDNSLSPQTTYRYQLEATDGAGNVSAPSTAATVTTPSPADTTPPTVPGNVTATATNPTSVSVGWDASTDDTAVTGYTVLRDGNPITTLDPTTTTYTDNGLSPQTTYRYQLEATDAAGNVSTPSPAATTTTPQPPDTSPPTVPTNVTATAVNGTSLRVSWSASTDNRAVTGYDVYRSGTLVGVVGSTTGYTDTGLTNATAYSYAVDAFDAAGNTGARSAAVIGSTPDTTPPSAPAGLRTTAVAYNAVSLSWAPSTDNLATVGYMLYRNGTLLSTFNSSTTSFVDRSVSAKTSYKYTVIAFDAAGNASASSAPLTATTPSAPDTTAPTAPGGFTAALTRTWAVYLSWKASTDNVGVTGYRVYRNGTLLTSVTTLYYSDQSAAQGVTYRYYVVANDAAGNVGPQSSTLTVVVPDKTAPSTPTNVKATAGVKSVVVSWTASTDNVGVAGYRIYRNGALVTSTTAKTYTNTGLTTGVTYGFTVVAFDAAGNASVASAAATAKPA